MVLDENRRDEIVRTIQQMRSQGATKGEIKTTLSQMGLADEEIETIMEKAEVDAILSARWELQKMVDEKLNQELSLLREQLLCEVDKKVKEEKQTILDEFDKRLANFQSALEKRFSSIADALDKKGGEITALEKKVEELRKNSGHASSKTRAVMSYTFLFIGLAVLMYVFYQYYVTGQWLSLIPSEFTKNPDTVLFSLGYLFGGILISVVLFAISQSIKTKENR